MSKPNALLTSETTGLASQMMKFKTKTIKTKTILVERHLKINHEPQFSINTMSNDEVQNKNN